METRPLRDLAKVIRSKNAKPFRITLDVIFDRRDVFDYVKSTNALTIETVARLYGLPIESFTSSFVFDAGMAFKFTYRRPIVQGALGDSDIYGAQQHVPLLDLAIPWSDSAPAVGAGNPNERTRAMSLHIGDVRSEPGTWNRGSVKVLTMLDGGDIAIPVHILTGTTPGPTLCLTAAMHGDETDSISTVMHIIRTVDLDKLSGTIVALPVGNPPALEFNKYYNPRDGMNLDFHAFPGNPRGTLTQQIAHALGEIVTNDKIDALIDVHSVPRSFPGLQMNYLYITPAEGEVAQPALELCLVQGYEIIYRGAPEVTPGSFVGHAIAQGIPASYSNGSVQGVENVMKHLGMIEGEPILPDRQFITQPPRLDLRPRHGGIIFPEFSLDKYPDQIVPEGTVLGRVISPYTLEEVDRMVAPFESAVLLWYEGTHPCHAGDYGYVIASMEHVEWIRGG
jgi:uncharacterized protein